MAAWWQRLVVSSCSLVPPSVHHSPSLPALHPQCCESRAAAAAFRPNHRLCRAGLGQGPFVGLSDIKDGKNGKEQRENRTGTRRHWETTRVVDRPDGRMYKKIDKKQSPRKAVPFLRVRKECPPPLPAPRLSNQRGEA